MSHLFDSCSDAPGWVYFLPVFLRVNLHNIYTALQGGLVLWFPLSPVAALRFVASAPTFYLVRWASVLVFWHPLPSVAVLWFAAAVPSSYLADVIACLGDKHISPLLSLRRHRA